MPSKKPIVHFNTERWLIDKMKFIAKEDNRSLANKLECLCKQCIKEYELQYGEIDIRKEYEEEKESRAFE